MSFMQRFIYGPQFGWQVETDKGTEWIRSDVVPVPKRLQSNDGTIVIIMADCAEWDHISTTLYGYVAGDIKSAEVVHGYFGCYLSSNNHWTPWHFNSNRKRLQYELESLYGLADYDQDRKPVINEPTYQS